MTTETIDNPLGLPLTWSEVGDDVGVGTARRLLRSAFEECVRLVTLRNQGRSDLETELTRRHTSLLGIVPCAVVSAAENEPDSEDAQMMALEMYLYISLISEQVGYRFYSQRVGDFPGRYPDDHVQSTTKLWFTKRLSCDSAWLARITRLGYYRGGAWRAMAPPDAMAPLVDADPIRAMNELNDIRAAMARVDLKPVRPLQDNPEAKKFLTAFFRED